MKWIKKIHKDKETRIKSGFLFFPKCLSNEDDSIFDCRWWEYAHWEEEYYIDWDGSGQWCAVRWINEEASD